MTSLGIFQQAFTAALSGAGPYHELSALAGQPGFAVYRNTVMKGLIDALQANYPAVCRLVGEDWFRAAARCYAESHLPQDPRLLYYGEDFAEFLGGFGPAAGLGYLAKVARLDRLWSEVHGAADAAVLDPAALSGMTPEALAGTVLHLHPAVRWTWFENEPIYTIWKHNREETAIPQSGIDWHSQGALLTRPAGAVLSNELDAAACAFLDACKQGRTLGEAAVQALHADLSAKLDQLLAMLLRAGTFSAASSFEFPLSHKEPS